VSKTYVLIACGAAKLSAAAPAGELYVGPFFRRALQVAQGEAFGDATVLILSALHGLVTLDTVLAPYDCKMGSAGSVTSQTVAAQAEALGITWGDGVYALLPKAYLAVADVALRSLDVYVQDTFEDCKGIGYQRQALRCSA
jgi:hypothetical protein